MNCKFNRFSTEKLLRFLKKLDREVILMINQKTPLDNQQGICLSLWAFSPLPLGQQWRFIVLVYMKRLVIKQNLL
jgi:hypothetical protein